MSDRKKQLNNDDLLEVKSLIGDADGEQFSLDDILAEYGSGKLAWRGAVPVASKEKTPAAQPDLPWPAPPSAQKRGENVVTFPGTEQAPQLEEKEPEGEHPKQLGQDPEKAPAKEQPVEEENSQEEQVLSFPEEESALSAFLKDVSRKADDYADRMFEEDERINPEEVRRLERLIPGTDQEEAPKEDLRRFRRAPRPEPPPPDRSPQELARDCGQGLKGLRMRTLLVFLLAFLALIQTLVPTAGLVWVSPLNNMVLQAWIAVGLLGLGILLGMDVLLSGLGRAVHGKVGMDTFAALSCLFTLADGAVLALVGNPEGRLPYSVVALAGLLALLHGTYHKKCGLRLSCRTAAASSQPYRVTLDGGKWNGRDTYVKWVGTAEGFGSQIQADDGAQHIFRRYCPVLLLGDLLLALLATAALGRPGELLWGLSALFTVTAAFGGTLTYGRSFHKVARRLVQSGATLAGWPGVIGSKRGDRVLITDTDLFPAGYVELNGYKVLGNFPMERVVAYTATLIRDSGSGLTKLFHDQLRTLGGLMRTADRLCCYEGGGLSANIRGDQVLVGSAAFMNLMEISLPPGLNVKNAVFCAINGELAGIFALSYSLPDTAFPSLEELMHEKVGPVLATRDFNLIPAMLHQRFKLAADKMDFPPVERRRELSDPEQPHAQVLTALLCREGLFPFAEAVVAAKRLRWATRLGAVLCCVGSTLGLLLSAYLVSVSAFGSLCPLNLLIYMATWLAPVWLLSGWVHRY
ncbi:MAG: hypothetical protein VB071_08850 [Lawsonibacter sp.]|nr:hypothetical protein [Lawsonibacter sp.]